MITAGRINAISSGTVDLRKYRALPSSFKNEENRTTVKTVKIALLNSIA
jgi:hypothetical protein